MNNFFKMSHHKNPLQPVANAVQVVQGLGERMKAKGGFDPAERAMEAAEELNVEVRFVDITIQFIGASNLPKMDIAGTADPYFHARIDKALVFVSSVQAGTLSPVWNEVWRIKNVPTTATIQVDLHDKDNGAPVDDYIGKFSTSVSPGTREVEIEGPLFIKNRGTFWLKVETQPSGPDARSHPYLFDGPIRYSKHSSPTVGALANLKDTRLYSTWKVYIKGIPLFFGDTVQLWNKDYKAAQKIFKGPTSIAVRKAIQAGHHLLYARTLSNGFGDLDHAGDFYALLLGGDRQLAGTKEAPFANRIKPAVYTYVIAEHDQSFRFSETGAAFFVDFASKHALHSNCAESVYYSGEFHPRPKGGWEHFSDDIPDDKVKWELVIDNNSGTYAPDPKMLPQLRALMEYNFADFEVCALDHGDPELKKSTDACREYATRVRGVSENDLQPHAAEGEQDRKSVV